LEAGGGALSCQWMLAYPAMGMSGRYLLCLAITGWLGCVGLTGFLNIHMVYLHTGVEHVEPESLLL